MVVPGHGALADKKLFDKQKRYFVDMRQQIKKAIDDGKKLDEIPATLDMAWYKDWTGKAAKDIRDNIRHVYDELQGKIDPTKLGYDLRSPLPYGVGYGLDSQVTRRLGVSDGTP
ncbi:MAG TPA: hypothetical protein PLN21_17840 [Gemmatales bacterium]|nr:hypothetical protein [Gemmatales bacterium]